MSTVQPSGGLGHPADMPDVPLVCCDVCRDGAVRRLDAAVKLIDLARTEGNAVLCALPADAPLFSVVDLVSALGHLRQASVLIDSVAESLNTEAASR